MPSACCCSSGVHGRVSVLWGKRRVGQGRAIVDDEAGEYQIWSVTVSIVGSDRPIDDAAACNS